MSDFAVFEGHNYLNIKTFRTNGEGVPTPVWFYKEDDTLYITTGKTSGKVKRIRQNPQVEVAPCEADGVLLGDFEPAQAELLQSDGEQNHAYTLLKSKYGHEDVWTNMVERGDPAVRTYIKVMPRA